jgi:hypothetical protein
MLNKECRPRYAKDVCSNEDESCKVRMGIVKEIIEGGIVERKEKSKKKGKGKIQEARQM